jgi:hypothetical protein
MQLVTGEILSFKLKAGRFSFAAWKWKQVVERKTTFYWLEVAK